MSGLLRQPEAFNLIPQQTVSDPFSHYEDSPIPEYLDCGGYGHTNYLSFDRSTFSIDEESQRKTFLGFIPPSQASMEMNKHEQLFGTLAVSKDFKFLVFQFLNAALIIVLAWSHICFLGYSLTAVYKIMEDQKTKMEICLLVLPPIAHLLIASACYAVLSNNCFDVLKTFTLTTNLEMMKDRKAIEEVVKEQKYERSERNYRVFQAMRLIRREYISMIYPDLSSMTD